MAIILASKSPRRKELLGILGVDFDVVTSDIDEASFACCTPQQLASKLSVEKAKAVCSKVKTQDIIISADTIVVFDNKIMGKPKNTHEAAQMLKTLSGNTHHVITGVTVMSSNELLTEAVTTEVEFRPLGDEEISAYIRTGEPMDKAGAYGIQGKASVFINRINGDYFNVVGLPLSKLCIMLKHFGIQIF